MSAVVGDPHLAGIAREAAVTCVNETNGQFVCNGTSSATAVWVPLLVSLALLIIMIVAYVSIIRQAGYSGWWVLVGLVPVVNLIMLFVFAFSTWPVTRQLRLLQGTGRYGRPNHPIVPAPGTVPPGPGTPAGPAPAGPVATAGLSEHVASQVDIPSFDQVMRTGGPLPSAGFPGAAAAAAASSAAVSCPEAGWYPAPGGQPGQVRYWDGTAWTEHVR